MELKLICIVIVTLLFITYYNLCNKKTSKRIFIFIILATLLRILIPLEINSDYPAYATFKRYSLLSFQEIAIGPIMNLTFNFLNIFIRNNVITLGIIYWLNFFICNYLFIKIIDFNIPTYKKIFLFANFYILFTYTLVFRNGIAYLLVFYFFYYQNSEKVYKSKLLLTSVLFHISAILVVILNYFSNLGVKKLISLLFSIVLLIIIMAFGFSFFEPIINKINRYIAQNQSYKGFHIFWLIQCIALFILGIYENKNATSNLLYIMLFLAYIIAFFLNPVMGYRLSIYFLMYYLSFNVTNLSMFRLESQLNKLAIALLIVLIFQMLKTNHFEFIIN